MTTTPELGDALAKLEQADADRATALAELDTAQRQQATARQQAVTQAWQAWTDQWDPKADDQAVADAHAALEEAARTGPLRPLLDVLLAEHRRAAHRRLAARAVGAGATVPDHRGAPDPSFAAELLPRLLDNLAGRTTADETTAVETAVRDALAAIPGGKPVAYRITSPRQDSWVTQIGGQPNLEWHDGAVVLDAGDARVDYFRRRTNDYSLEPLYVVADPSTIAPVHSSGSDHNGLSSNHPGKFLLTPAERAARRAKTG